MVGRGRKKTKTTLIEEKKARDVCFCKRRAGLFKKARELSILCGAKVGILIFSSSGKPKTFDAPTLETFIDQQLRQPSSDDIPSLESESPPPAACAETKAPFWWERPDVGSMTLDELKTFASSLSAAIEERNRVKDGDHDFDAEGKMMGENLFTSSHEASSIPEFNEVISSSQSNQMKSHVGGDPTINEYCWNVAAAAEQMMDASSFHCCPTPGIEEQLMMDENFFTPGCWPSSTYIGGPQLSISFEDEPSRIDGRQLVAPNLLLGSPAVDASNNASFQPSTWTDFFMQRQWI